ncbi:unnamed protein product [Cuscuta campestris]|uniref:Uncharacterized protein n=1 Tax=Cuscuta campestris TaxID=132261 RepID=A0A484NEF7_9ASTE|nr:unnamed protein product [Cuscuta campestris]
MNSSKSQKWTNTQGRTKSEGVCLITTRSEESSIVSGGYELARLIYVASEPKIAGHSWTVVFGRGFIVDLGEHCQIPLWLPCSKHKLRPEPTEDWKSEVSPRFPIAVAHPHSGGSALSSTREEQASPEFWRPRRSIQGFRFGRRTLDKGR